MKLISFSELKTAKGISYSRRRIRQLTELGAFPRPLKMSAGPQGHIAWIESEVDAHLERLAAARDQAAE
jgi:predicted DNA-binding transcriptional regulator AlpA